MSFKSLLNKEVYLQTRASSQNDIREWAYTYTSATSTTKCRLSPLSMAERTDPTGRYDDVRYKGYFTYDTSIDKDSRLVYGGESYRVKECIVDSENHHRNCLLVLI